MRLISAALLGAAASLPTLVHAMTTIPDPADAAAPVPPITVPSTVDGYRPYDDSGRAAWRQLNQAVQDTPRMSGMTHGGTMNRPTDGAPTPNHSPHQEIAR
jgi:hypothetical protein